MIQNHGRLSDAFVSVINCRALWDFNPSILVAFIKNKNQKLAQGKPACPNGNEAHHREKNLACAMRVRKKKKEKS